MSLFKKDLEGNWFNTKTNYFLGTEDHCSIYTSLVESGEWSVEEIIDLLMNTVNASIEG